MEQKKTNMVCIITNIKIIKILTIFYSDFDQIQPNENKPGYEEEMKEISFVPRRKVHLNVEELSVGEKIEITELHH